MKPNDQLWAGLTECLLKGTRITKANRSLSFEILSATAKHPIREDLKSLLRARNVEGIIIDNKHIRVQVKQLLWRWFNRSYLLFLVRLVFKCMFIGLQL